MKTYSLKRYTKSIEIVNAKTDRLIQEFDLSDGYDSYENMEAAANEALLILREDAEQEQATPKLGE